MSDGMPAPHIDGDGRQWYSKRTFIHAQQTKKRAAARAQAKEAERLARLGVDVAAARLGTERAPGTEAHS